MIGNSIQMNRSRIFKWRAENVLYFFLFLLPIIWIQEKMVQMVVEIAVLLLMLIIEKRQTVNRLTLPMLVYVAIHIFSILFNLGTNEESVDSSRVIAAFNTAFVWILGSVVFSAVIRIKLDKRKIIKMMTFLYWVIILECVLAIIASRFGEYITINGRGLYKFEWFNNADRIRSFCWMEYASLVPFLLFCVLPYVYIGINRRKPVYRIITMACSLLPLYLCNSRLGLVLVLALIGWMSAVAMWKHRVLRVVLLILCLGALTIMLAKIGVVFGKVESLLCKLLFGREASNITRMTLYTATWEKIKESSLLFGAGIKHITVIRDIPLGSHSSYLGAIYKAGFIGAAFLFYFFIKTTGKIAGKVKKRELNMIFLVSLLGIFALMIMEDIDGANWMHFLFFIHLGIIIRQTDKEGVLE